MYANLFWIAFALVIAGALNWGSISLLGTDVVNQATGGGQVARVVKGLVGLAGLYLIYEAYRMYDHQAKLAKLSPASK